MQRIFCLSLCLAILPALPCAAQSKQSKTPALKRPPTVQKHFERAQIELNEGKYEAASKELAAAVDAAKDLPANDQFVAPAELRAEAMLSQAQLILQSKSGDLNAALKLYQDVARQENVGSPQQKALAQANAAVTLLKLKRPAEAAKLLDDLNWDLVDAREKYLLYFNHGRALQEAGDPEKALLSYCRSLASNPYHEPASQRADALALEIVTRDETKVFETGQWLVRLGCHQNAVTLALEVLRKQREPGAPAHDALRVLLLSWWETYHNADAFAKEQGRVLAELRDSPWSEFAREVELATRGKLNLNEIRERGVNKDFPWLTHNDRPTLKGEFATFLAATGTPFAQYEPTNANLEQAAARIYGAWRLAPHDLALAKKVAWLSRDYRAEIDPRGSMREELMSRMFQGKFQSYALKGKTAKDWENILAQHMFLAGMYEEEKNWGDERDSHSAIFQWTYAIRAEQQIRKLEPEADFRAPGLYESLARAYQQNKQPSLAFDTYLEAGRTYAQRGVLGTAQRMADTAEKLEFPRTNEQTKALQALRQGLTDAVPRKNK